MLTFSQEQRRISPLKSWLCNHGESSLQKFLAVNGDFSKPMLFSGETPQRKFAAYIDPENTFCIEDKLSQVITNYIYNMGYKFSQPLFYFI